MTFSEYIDVKVTIAVTKEKAVQRYKLAEMALHLLLGQAHKHHQAFESLLAEAQMDDDLKEMVREMYLSGEQ